MEKVFYDSLHISKRNSNFSLIVKKAHYSGNKWRVFKQKMADSISHYLFLLQKSIPRTVKGLRLKTKIIKIIIIIEEEEKETVAKCFWKWQSRKLNGS